MELLSLLKNNNLNDFNDIKKFLESDDYQLIVKEDNDFPELYMVTYDKDKEIKNNISKQCRGLILEKNTNKIVCYTFNKGIDYDIDIDEINDLKGLDWNSTKIERSIDGTQIRLYYYNNEWRYATTRCIDAKKARWFSSLSFYDLFKDADNIDYEKLNKNYCYSFVLCHPKNRIVVKYDYPYIIHVMTRDMITLKEIDVNIDIKKPEIFYFKSFDELINDAKNTDNLEEGYMLCDKNYNRMKIKNNSYKKIKKLRGNTNNLFYHYLQLKYENTLDLFLSFYPEYKNKFNLFDLDIRNLAKEIHKIYMNKHVFGNPYIPKYMKNFIYKLHGKYLSTKKITTIDIILNVIYESHPSQIIFIYNRTFTPFHPYHTINNDNI
jgi:hypothetical protein